MLSPSGLVAFLTGCPQVAWRRQVDPTARSQRLAESGDDRDQTGGYCGAALRVSGRSPPKWRAVTGGDGPGLRDGRTRGRIVDYCRRRSVCRGLSLLTTVPMGLLGYRYRLRVLVAATFAASVVAFLIAGVSGLMVVVNCAYVGGLAGIMKRRGRGTPPSSPWAWWPAWSSGSSSSPR